MTENCTDFPGDNQNCIDYFDIESEAKKAGNNAKSDYIQKIEMEPEEDAPASEEGAAPAEGGKKKAKKSKK